MKALENREKWIKTLYKLQLHNFTATFLEALGPINFLGAQLVYLGQPILSPLIPREQTGDLAKILEDPTQTKEFITALRSYEPTP